MHISIFSFLTSVIWSSIAIIVIYLLRKKNYIVRHFGILSIIFIYMFCIIRAIVPFEFFFTKELFFADWFNSIYKIIHLDRLVNSKISILIIFLYIWVGISIILISNLFYQYRKAMRQITRFHIVKSVQCDTIYQKVQHESNKNININIRHNKNIDIPIGIGLFNKTIILPDDKYTDIELYHILLHEYTHFMNYDLHVKLLVQIFCCIYWWNPIIYLLRKDLEQALELKCDLSVTQNMSIDDKANYMKTLLSILKKTTVNSKMKLYCTTSLFNKKYKDEIIQRFNIITGDFNVRGKIKNMKTIWILMFAILIWGSYLFVIQPSYDPSILEIVDEVGMFEVLPENTYIIKNENGIFILTSINGASQIIEEDVALAMNKQGFEILEDEKR